MGKQKPVEVNYHFAWIWDNAVCIVFAHMYAAGSHVPSITDETLLSWASHASIGNSIMFTYPRENDVDPETMATVFAEVRQTVIAMGDVSFEMLKQWSLPGHREVCGGEKGWRGETVDVERLLEVVDWFDLALSGEPEAEYGAYIACG